MSSSSTRYCCYWLMILAGCLLLRISSAKKLPALFDDERQKLEELASRLSHHHGETTKDLEIMAALQSLHHKIHSTPRPVQETRHRHGAQEYQEDEEPTVVVLMDEEKQKHRQHRQELLKHLMKPDLDYYEYTGTKKPVFIYQNGKDESDLPVCKEKNEACSRVDIYAEPWIERLCRCPGSRTCSRSVSSNDGHTVIDRTHHYKLCEPVKRLPTCEYFKDISITMTPIMNPKNGTSYKIHCKCRPGSATYLTRRDKINDTKATADDYAYSFSCSPHTKLRCKKKEPCRLFSVRDRLSYPGVDASMTRVCNCPRGHYCPRHHNDIGSAWFYSKGNTAYNGHCMPNVLLPFESSSNGYNGYNNKKKQQPMYTVVN